MTGGCGGCSVTNDHGLSSKRTVLPRPFLPTSHVRTFVRLSRVTKHPGHETNLRYSASDGPRAFGLGVVSRPRLDYPAELLFDLAVQREGINFGVP
jgi:hypothetical protein